MKEKLEKLAARINEDRRDFHAKWVIMQGLNVSFLAERIEQQSETRIVYGKKYTKIDVGPPCNWSGKFMVDQHGNIFGIKGYGVINKNKKFGNLDTIDNFYWGDYLPIPKQV